MRFSLILGIVAALGLQSLPSSAQSGMLKDAWRSEEFRQFDFWIGKWDVNLRTIQADQSWKDTVKAKVEIYSILDGKAILELWDSPSIKGFSLRYFDPAKQRWVLYLNWPSNSQSSVGSLEGSFRHGRGEFFSGPPLGQSGGLISRYSFCDIGPQSLRWDDAFSSDGGRTWNHNWIMEFSRTAAFAAWPKDSLGHTFESGSRCEGDAFDALNSLAGEWAGVSTLVSASGESTERNASLRVYHVLDGCSVLSFLTVKQTGQAPYRRFGLLTYNSSSKQYEELSLDNQAASAAQLYRGQMDGGSLALVTRAAPSAKHATGLRRHLLFLPLQEERVRLELAHSPQGELWTTTETIVLEPATSAQDDAGTKQVLNSTCPRSGKAVASDSLGEYRGRVVGFCNTHCRDDFMGNLGQRPADQAFFDALIDGE